MTKVNRVAPFKTAGRICHTAPPYHPPYTLFIDPLRHLQRARDTKKINTTEGWDIGGGGFFRLISLRGLDFTRSGFHFTGPREAT